MTDSTASSTRPTSSDDVAVAFPFAFDLPFRLAALPFGVVPSRAQVLVHDDVLRIEFGHWTVETPLANVEGAAVTGPYLLPKVIGPPHLSFKDRGLTFATNARQGTCIRFREPVTGLAPRPLSGPWLRHPAVTVTVAEPAELAELLDHAASIAAAAPEAEPDLDVQDLLDEVHDDLESLTASELRDRAQERGLDGTSSMGKRELIDALSVSDEERRSAQSDAE